MAEPRQTITISIDAQDLPGTQHVLGEGKRSEITPAGMLGVANNTGMLELLINGHSAVRLSIVEDRYGHGVIQVHDTTRNVPLGVVDIELYGLVPPRRNAQPRKDRRFGQGFGTTSG
ncbi:hypothetical protein SEA_PHINKY_84 [Microbacterium phage Phinky]|nr:hypothetical protein SEA_PHINKY_84 [Microbacterium phage Phinky]